MVAHLDHALRPDASARDAEWVASFAAGLGLRCVVERADVRALARQQRRSLEDAARVARYAFLRRVARDVDAERICTGHTQDDQAETVLLHLVRGSGLAGLAGMRPLEGDVARPLLALTRADTVSYCTARGWQPLTDASNTDPRYQRNRIRHELLPLLEQYNPNVRATLARNAALLAADEDYLDTQTEAAWSTVVMAEDAHGVTFALDALRAQPLALRHRLLRRACQRLAGYERVPEARHLAAADDMIERSQNGKALDLPGGLRLRLSYQTVAIERRTQDMAALALAGGDARDEMLALPIPGTLDLPHQGWRLRAWLSDLPPGNHNGDAGAAATLPAFSRGRSLDADLRLAETRVYLDADAAGDALTVRAWRPGDRFRPLGMVHEKKLQDFFSDAKVPRELRSRLPLVFGRDHLLWVAGMRIDNRARVTPQTRRVLVLQIEPLTL